MKYLVTVDISATKQYQFNSGFCEDDFRIWAHDNVERFDTITNPIQEFEHIEIKDIELVIPTMSKKQVYDKLAKYLEELTSNDEPLELLKMLKPEE
jgi:hypothetical protein